MKRSELKRGTSQMKRSEWRPARKAIRPVSKRRARVNRERARNQLIAWGPRPWVCELGPVIGTPCFGEVNGHELLKRSRSGKDSNLTDVSGQMRACEHHNGWVEMWPIEAEALGLSKPSGVAA